MGNHGDGKCGYATRLHVPALPSSPALPLPPETPAGIINCVEAIRQEATMLRNQEPIRVEVYSDYI